MTSLGNSQLLVGTLFSFFVLITVAGAIIAVSTRRIIRSVAGLAVSCLGLAGLYYFLRSPFLALMEILIYVGAVCITIVFAIMLAEPDESTEQETRGSGLLWGTLAFTLAGVIFWVLVHLGLNGPWTARTAPAGDGSVQAIGVALLTTYSLAFELISIVLLVAILGALIIARTGRHHS